MSINKGLKYEFIEVKFYEYTIRMTIIDNTKMYVVTDLLKQYNENNNTNKRIAKWLKREDTHELLQYCRDKTCDPNGSHENDEDDFVDIPGVIMKIDKFYNNNTNIKAYLVNGIILHDILFWIDKVFAYNVCSFLDNMREINNDRFVEILNSNKEKDKQIELLQEQVDQLKSRYTPEEYSVNTSASYNYHFCVAYNELTNIATTVITKDQYQPADKNVKRLYDLICPNPLVLEQQLLDILANDNRFTQISNKEFRTIIDSKHLFWYFKSKCKKLRTNLEWKTGLVINETI